MLKEEEIIEEKDQKQVKESDTQIIEHFFPSKNRQTEFNNLLIKEFKEMTGSPEEKIKKILNRFQKFFLRDKHAKINIRDGYFQQSKRQPFYHVKGVYPLQNQLILFGVDFQKDREIVKKYQPQELIPMDMSHMKLIFPSFQQALKALCNNQRKEVQQHSVKLQINKPIEEVYQNFKNSFRQFADQRDKKISDTKSTKNNSSSITDTQIPHMLRWMQMDPYYVGNFERRVLARFATNEQKDVIKNRNVSSNIPVYARKVFELKKKDSEDIIENFRLRQERLIVQKQERRSERGMRRNKQNRAYHEDNIHQGHEVEGSQKSFNHQIGDKNIHQDHEVEQSQKSFNYQIGGQRNSKNQNNDEKSERSFKYQRERSRQRDFDNVSVGSKKSSTSSIINKFNKNMNLKDYDDDKSSVYSDVSFILHRDPQLQLNLAIRLGRVNIQQQQQKNGPQSQISEKSFVYDPNHQNPNNSMSSEVSLNSYRLSSNMPDHSHNQRNKNSQQTNKSKFDYNKYNEQQEREAQRRKTQEREIVVIDID